VQGINPYKLKTVTNLQGQFFVYFVHFVTVFTFFLPLLKALKYTIMSLVNIVCNTRYSHDF